jgi:uncharacterized membrane protein
MAFEKETARIEAFSDGVFAIAITLLVLDLKVPPIETIHARTDLWQELGKLWPSYFAFVLSFGFLLIAWINHHITFKFIEGSSLKFMYANGFLLFNIILLPFPTAVLSEYFITQYSQAAIVLYCCSSTMQNLSWIILYAAVSGSKLVKNDRDSMEKFKRFSRASRYAFLIYVIITIMAWWFPLTAMVINTCLWFYWMSLSLTSRNKIISHR